MSRLFVVGYIDWTENELFLERHSAATWQDAVRMHSHYPWKNASKSLQPSLQSAEVFKQQCYDCDCAMNWIEL